MLGTKKLVLYILDDVACYMIYILSPLHYYETSCSKYYSSCHP